MLYPLLIAGGVWFWCWIAFWFLCATMTCGRDRAELAIVWLLGLGLALLGFTDTPWSWLWMHWIETLIGFGLYLVPCGVSYTFWRWWRLVHQAKAAYENGLVLWLADLDKLLVDVPPKSRWSAAEIAAIKEAIAAGHVMTPALEPIWDKCRGSMGWIDSWGIWHYGIGKPNADDFSDEIAGWIAFWPLLAAWELIHDPIEKILDLITEGITSLLHRITDWVWED